MRAITEIIEALRNFSTTELCDGMTEFRVLDPAIRRMATKKKIAGAAFPVEIPAGVSGIIPDALMEIEPGQVLVIAAQGFTRQSCWGDYRSFCAKMRHVEGVVIDGAFRDIEGCEEIGVPIFARGVVPRAGGKARDGRVNVAVEIGGVRVSPGDIIVGDADGVVVVRQEEAEEIMARARKKSETEAAAIKRMEETGEVLPRANLLNRQD